MGVIRLSYYDEFYGECSEYDQMISEFKQSLMDAVKEEYVDKMNKLEKENAELQDVKKNLEQIKQEHQSKLRELEMEKHNCIQQARRERLSALIGDRKMIMYRAYSKGVLQPKCDKCNDNRKIEFKSPLGNDMYEDCGCNIKKAVYIPMEYTCIEFRVHNDGVTMLMWYKENHESDYDWYGYSSSNLVKRVYNERMDYENDVDKNDTYFQSEDDCAKYCDWLNNLTE